MIEETGRELSESLSHKATSVAVIQARMGSTRLPGKVLHDIGGRSMLAMVVQRTGRARLVDGVVVATTDREADEPIVRECDRLGVPVFRGSEQDVLDRYYGAARAFQAQVVVRVTSDCPFIDPGVIDHVLAAFLQDRPDYASNVLERTYPRGLDTEVMSIHALERAWREASEPYQRIHVTPYFYHNPDLFRLLSVTQPVDWSRYRWTVDTADDLAFVREVVRRLAAESPRVAGAPDAADFRWTDLLALLAREPSLAELNRAVRQKQLDEG